uniref:dUTPase-like domain-containing protein n=1 Tax=Anser cygnoides TaxID=8845 RepID=A0A8B9ENF0_ANSCY
MGTDPIGDPRLQAHLDPDILRLTVTLALQTMLRIPETGKPGSKCNADAGSSATCSPAATVTTVDTLSARTRGSAGVDVSTVPDATLWGTHVHKIPLNVKGPIGNGCSALLLGRSSTTLTGLFVLPGIIDDDYNGQIQAMAWTPSPPLSMPKGTRIAKLILFRAVVPRAVDAIRGAAGFGSTGFPEGMKNSPTMCQTSVAKAIQPVCQCFPEIYIYTTTWTISY